jgi:hypothetical protein
LLHAHERSPFNREAKAEMAGTAWGGKPSNHVAVFRACLKAGSGFSTKL